MEYQENPPTPPHPPSTLGVRILDGIIVNQLVRADSAGVCVWHSQTEEILEKIALDAIDAASKDGSGICPNASGQTRPAEPL